VDDSSGFCPSLPVCPNLTSFHSYKLWGLGGPCHQLHLPKCYNLGLNRAHDLQRLELWPPSLMSLNLHACYGIEKVRLHGDEGPMATVNMVNANIDRASLAHLRSHPRVGRHGLQRRDELMDELGGGGFFEDEDDDEDGYGSEGSGEDEYEDDGLEGFHALPPEVIISLMAAAVAGRR
jgi:hypothetical protein